MQLPDIHGIDSHEGSFMFPILSIYGSKLTGKNNDTKQIKYIKKKNEEKKEETNYQRL